MVFPVIGVAYFVINDWEMFKKHLISCEYLQIDPSKPHDADFIEERAEHVMSQWKGSGDRSSARLLRTALDEYVKTVRFGPEMPMITKMVETADSQKHITEPHAQDGNAMWGSAERPKLRRRDTISETLAKRTAKLVKEGKLEIQPGTVSETYVKKELRQDNFDDYMRKLPKWPN